MSGILSVGFFRLAKNISKYSNHRHKIGCVLVNHKPFSVGYNIIKTSPKIADPSTSFRKSIHAEMRAIKNSDREIIKNGTAYVYRETRVGTPANARPCEMCMNALKEFGIKKIYYTIDSYPYYSVEKV